MISANHQMEHVEKEQEAVLSPTQGKNNTTHESLTSSFASDKDPMSLEAGIGKDEKIQAAIIGELARVPTKSTSVLEETTSNILAKVSTHLTTRSIIEPGPPPDGGLKAWTQVACGWLVLFSTWGYVNSFGVFQAYYTTTLSLPPSTISWIGSVQVFLCLFVSTFSGRMLDAGLFLPTFILGCVVQLLGIFMMSMSTKYWHLLLTQGAMTGLGSGIIFCPAMGLVTTWFSSRRAIAVGLATTGNSIGGIVYPVLARELLGRIGFAWTARVLGFLNLTILCLVICFMRPRLPPRKSGPIIEWAAWVDGGYAFFVIGMMFMMWNQYFVLYYLASFGVDVIHLSYSTSTTLIMIVNGAGFTARIIPPFIAQRIGCLNVLIPVLLISSILVYSWATVSTSAGLYTFTVLYGFIYSSFQCLFPTTVASLTPKLNMVGTRLGMAFSIMSLAALTGPPLGGALIRGAGSVGAGYVAAMVWAGSAGLLGWGLVAAGRVTRFGWNVRTKC